YRRHRNRLLLAGRRAGTGPGRYAAGLSAGSGRILPARRDDRARQPGGRPHLRQTRSPGGLQMSQSTQEPVLGPIAGKGVLAAARESFILLMGDSFAIAGMVILAIF